MRILTEMERTNHEASAEFSGETTQVQGLKLVPRRTGDDERVGARARKVAANRRDNNRARRESLVGRNGIGQLAFQLNPASGRGQMFM